MKSLEENLVVGVGTSAGGLEALKLFFNNIPSDTKLSFVVIQHLSSDHKSLMKDLLAKGTDLTVLETTNNLSIKPGHIYLIPPKNNIVFKQGKLHLIEKAGKNQLNLPIDIFFHSLAKEKKEKSVGIILTGTGSDGVEGIKSIKSEGGLIMVQNASEAKFNGMPISAINTGIVDFVLPVNLLANELIRYGNTDDPLKFVLPENISEEQIITAILNQILYRSQLNFNEYKRPTILRRIQRRMVVNNIKNLKGYLDYIGKNPEETDILYKEFLIPVTKFYRDPEAWNYLNKEVVPDIVSKANTNETIKVWCVGCCTGEEVYSIAMSILEQIEYEDRNINVKIFATDIDKVSLKKAGEGLYPENIRNDVPERIIEKYFVAKGGKLKVKDSLRKRVIFSFHNIITDLPYNKMDLVICRNMLIYIKSAVQDKILNTLHYSLKKDKYLFLGSSESLGALETSFREVAPKLKIYQSKKDGKIKYFNRFTSASNDRLNSLDLGKTKSYPIAPNFLEVINNSLVEQLKVTSILTADNFEIIEVNGQFRKYIAFPEKGFSKYLNKILPKSLSFAVSSAMRRVDKLGSAVNFNETVELSNGTNSSINVNVSSVVDPREPKIKFYLIILKELEEKILHKKSELIELDDKTIDRINELEEELKRTKYNLIATVEVAETSNEELQATNEEMLASNEELQSTNEELQSVNEELHTVNAEFQAKISEISRLNTDNENLMTSTNIGTIFLDRDLNIRKFIGPATEQLNLLERDIGRRISDITSNLNDHTAYLLMKDVLSVFENGEIKESKVCTKNGDWFLQRTLPYLNSKSEQDGVVVSFIEINNLILTEESLKQNENRFRTLYEDAPVMHVNISPKDGKVFDCNRKLVERLGYASKKQIIGRPIFDLYHSSCLEEVQEAFSTFQKTGEIRDKELTLQERNGNKIPVILNTSSVRNDDGEILYSSSSWVEISKLKEVSEELKIRNKDLEQFTYLISHDLKAPLTNLKSLVDITQQKKYFKKEGEQVLKMIDNSCERLFDTITTLNDVVSLTWEDKLDVVKINVKEEINKILNSINFKINETNTKIGIDTKAQKFIHFAPVHFNLVIQNIVLNAIKYSKEDVAPEIIITSGKTKDSHFISIEDNGIGMDLNLVNDKLFTLFQRFHPEKQVEGKGIGLHITNNLMKKYGGDIEVTSEVNAGSKFVLYFKK